jgi:hypothetical protein
MSEVADWLEGVKAEQGPSEIVEALAHCCRTAVRAPHVFGTTEHPSAWDIAHKRLDVLLDEWLMVR